MSVAGPRLLVAGALVVAATACRPEPIAWRDAEVRSAPLPVPIAGAAPHEVADSLLRSTVGARLGGIATVPADPLGEMCPGSLRVAVGKGGGRLAAWWSLRPAPARVAWLVARRSADGGATWGAALAVDTLDRSTNGCERPAPAVALDSVNGFAHVAYTLEAPEGEGVFYAHQMDPRVVFEPPKVVVYGDRPSATSVASAGDVVLVAYEDPNTSGRPFISVALSRTGGHTFDARLAVSGRSVAAGRPAAAVRAALRGQPTEVVVGWIERAAPSSLSTLDDPNATAQTGYMVVRAGVVR